MLDLENRLTPQKLLQRAQVSLYVYMYNVYIIMYWSYYNKIAYLIFHLLVPGQVHFFPAIANTEDLINEFEKHGCAKL